MKFVWLSLMLFVGIAHASVDVVEIGNFYCPHCFAAESAAAKLSDRVINNGGSFEFVPVLTQAAKKWPVLVYLGLTSKRAEDIARGAFFNAAQVAKLDMGTLSQTCNALSTYSLISREDCLRAGRSMQGRLRYRKVLKLIGFVFKGNAQLNLPVFVFERDGQIIKVVSGSVSPTALSSLIGEGQ